MKDHPCFPWIGHQSHHRGDRRDGRRVLILRDRPGDVSDDGRDELRELLNRLP